MASRSGLNLTITAAMRALTEDFACRMDIDQTLSHVTAAAVDLIDGIDYADVMLVENGRFRSVAPTASMAIDLDHAQMRLQQGPCLQAAVADSVIRCENFRRYRRWPAFAAAAVEFGVHSILSFQLYTHRNGAGALNLLGTRPQLFSANAEAIGAMLATHAAIALIAANKEQQFESAIASRDVIGQAKGIVMERFKIDAEQAFNLLTKLSQESNIPVRALAQQLVDSV
jgi:transcriptional regulator with GAF, ATPase, and Fis domain